MRAKSSKNSMYVTHLAWLGGNETHGPCVFFNWAPRYEGVLGEWRYSSTHSLASVLDGG